MNLTRCAFIGGIPTAGKTTLAAKLAGDLGIAHVQLDELRAGMANDPSIAKWEKFFWVLDEEGYFAEATAETHCRNIIDISTAFWPVYAGKIREFIESGTPAIFESVNLLPHLVKTIPGLSGVYLLGRSFEEVLERNRLGPRWGNTESLQRKEANAIWSWERPFYESEARKYGYKVFDDPVMAGEELVRIMGGG
jgi:2-phosphoglycerate kinase